LSKTLDNSYYAMYSIRQSGVFLVDIQLKKGILDVCVLHAISRGESYGYKIISDLEGIIEISESTLYPILKRLETGGFVTTRTAEYSGRLRRYYKISNLGLKKLKSGRDDLLEINAIYKKLFGGRI
jgi:PadR family transcriptional regulator PadR